MGYPTMSVAEERLELVELRTADAQQEDGRKGGEESNRGMVDIEDDNPTELLGG